MFDKSRLKRFLGKYKEEFIWHWPKEKYKWEAVKQFQDNWDVKAEDLLLQEDGGPRLKRTYPFVDLSAFIKQIDKHRPDLLSQGRAHGYLLS